MAYQYEEPNPYARRLAVCAIENLAGYIATWMDGDDVQTPQARHRVRSGVSYIATWIDGPRGALSLYGTFLIWQVDAPLSSLGSGHFPYMAGGRLNLITRIGWHTRIEACIRRWPAPVSRR